MRKMPISQKITLQGDNLSLKDYLNTIEKQTDYLFIYDAGVNVNKKISVNMVGRSIKEVLDNLSTQLGLNYSQKGSYIVLSSYKAKDVSAPVVTQQKKTITGVVTDDMGEPIIGANVIEKGLQMVLSPISMASLHWKSLRVRSYRFHISVIIHKR